ncbi:MAG: EAL domain-containing protein [Thainema sp.]
MTDFSVNDESTRADILIVDDTPANLRFLASTLSQQGYKVRCVTNGRMALTAAQTTPPDLVLLDIRMPDLSGYEVCEQLKANPATQSIPVIFLSALNEAFDKVTAFKSGGADYISKPFQLEEILIRIQHQLQLKRAIEQFQQLNLELEDRVRQRTQELQQANAALQIANAALYESESRFRDIANTAPMLLWLANSAGDCIFFNQRWLEFTGRTLEEEIYDGWLENVHPDDRQAYYDCYFQAVHNQEDFVSEYRLLHVNGNYRWILDTGKPRYSQQGEFIGYIGSCLDISDRKQVEQELKIRERQFRQIFELAPAGMSILDLRGRFLNVNQALCNLLGYTKAELLQTTWLDVTHPDDLPSNLNLIQKIVSGDLPHAQLEKRYLNKIGETLYAVVSIAPLQNSQDELHQLAVQVIDITERKRAEEQLTHDAIHDGLTGLANRAFFMNQLQMALKMSERHSGYEFAILFVDVDRFKRINDSLGHVVGDQLLVAIANVLTRCTKPTDTVARLGGDEFAILLEDIHDIHDAIRVAQRIQDDLVPPFRLAGHDVVTTASIGIVLSAADYQHGTELLRDADIAMYRAKDNGRNCYEVFDKVMHARAVQMLRLEANLQRAIDQQEFVTHYQPIVSLTTGQLTGFEALIRWQSPEGVIPPNQFIPMAEDNGMIVPIGEWILQSACQQLRVWQQEFPHVANLQISVNLASRQLAEESLITQIDQILQSTGLTGACLKLELTERMLMENSTVVVSRLEKLKQRDIQLSIDDFGTGFSSLSYLHQFPIDTLKIDRSFVQQMDVTTSQSGIVQAIVNLAHALGMDAIAEGIESQQQVQTLQTLGCEYGQGYLFSRPLPAEQVRSLLANQSTWSL